MPRSASTNLRLPKPAIVLFLLGFSYEAARVGSGYSTYCLWQSHDYPCVSGDVYIDFGSQMEATYFGYLGVWPSYSNCTLSNSGADLVATKPYGNKCKIKTQEYDEEHWLGGGPGTRYWGWYEMHMVYTSSCSGYVDCHADFSEPLY